MSIADHQDASSDLFASICEGALRRVVRHARLIVYSSNKSISDAINIHCI
ncbi:hypothetical protein GJA_137 [Janthinobacterium agaricidamnosum NBRC 102515 = DSM 9628]|uniref:Uncharacterized protein n=1 Tax=Janthinobacterium agaricidamnosum NBRC 102515 = DSM 9628 TaxID=1349767 RepID=W0V0D6_9BURK|nr:hypothetical protein GJA_137 [Janthinobacterium agaricidamnosum NBRC 102515 = DSM 9628]